MKHFFLPILVAAASLVSQAQPSDSAQFYFNRGMEEKAARRFREAEKNFVKAYSFNPKDFQTLVELSNALLEQRRFAEAREKLILADGILPDQSQVIEKLAELSFNLRKFEESISYARKMQQLKIGKEVPFLIAKCYYELGNYGESLKYCEVAYKENAKDPMIPYIGARCYMEMSNYKKSAGCYEQALALDSNNATWMFEAGLIYYAIPNHDKALFWIQRAGEKGYKKSDEYLSNLAAAYLNAGQHQKGIDLMTDMLKNRPEDQEIMYNIAQAYYNIKKYDDAINYWDKALAIDKQNASALYMIGMSYQKKGDETKGKALCDKAIQMDPSLNRLKQERKMPGGL